MHICYIDESGTSDVPGTTSHFILAGLAIPIQNWKEADRQISEILAKWGLANTEFHTAWVVRKFIEQAKIPKFDSLDWTARRTAVQKYRNAEILRLQKAGNPKALRQLKKTYSHTSAYIHLTHRERNAAALEVAERIGSWPFARLFAECINKIHFDPTKTEREVDVQAFEQVVSRFQQYLQREYPADKAGLGLLVHDNNDTISRKHTSLMRDFHSNGTLWTSVDRIIETPLFVDSGLTRMIQIADLCSFALRRFVENGETALFAKVFAAADRIGTRVVGVRHFAGLACRCAICDAHHRG